MITGMPRIAIAVYDFDHAVATFRDKLGMPVVDLSPESVDTLGAKLAMCIPDEGSNIEIMSPGDPGTALSQSLQKFIDRRGEGHFALMLEAADPDAEAKELIERGLNVLPRMDGAGGRDVHPNSTHGVLIRIYPIDSYVGHDSDHQPGENPPALSGIKRVIIAVHDIEEAIDTYAVKFAIETSAAVSDLERGVRSAVCNPPTGGAIELVAVENPGRGFANMVEEFLNTRGEGLFALILHAPDVQQTTDVLTARGLNVDNVVGSAALMGIGRESMYGARFWIE